MKTVIFLIGILAVKLSDGWPKDFSIENQVHKMTENLVKPLLDKSKEADETLANAWKAYNEKMSVLNKKISALEKAEVGDKPTTQSPATTTPDPNSCKSLRESMNAAQRISNDAAELSVKVMADLYDVVLSSPDCFTVNIFRAASCSAHKLKDVKDIYINYKPKLTETEEKLAEALKIVGKEFISCFHRVN